MAWMFCTYGQISSHDLQQDVMRMYHPSIQHAPLHSSFNKRMNDKICCCRWTTIHTSPNCSKCIESHSPDGQYMDTNKEWLKLLTHQQTYLKLKRIFTEACQSNNQINKTAHDAGYANLGTVCKHPDNQSITSAAQDFAAPETQRTVALAELTATNGQLSGQLHPQPATPGPTQCSVT